MADTSVLAFKNISHPSDRQNLSGYGRYSVQYWEAMDHMICYADTTFLVKKSQKEDKLQNPATPVPTSQNNFHKVTYNRFHW